MPLRSTLASGLVVAVCAGKPEPEAPMSAQVEHAGGPQDVQYAYEGKREEASPAGDAQPEAAEQPAADAIDPAALEERVREAALAVLPAHESLLVSPPLPIGWPAEANKVMYVIWPLDPHASGGLAQWKVGRALGIATVTLVPESIAVEPITPAKKAKPLGSLVHERPRGNDPVRGAESALFEIVTGKREPEKARFLFKRYGEWIDHHAVVRTELRSRATAFFAWSEQ